MLECHTKNCLVLNHSKSVLLPEEITYINFQNLEKLTKAPFINYDGFECVLIPSTDYIDFGSNANKYQDHILCSYGYKLIYLDERFSKAYKTYFG